ncbi:2470_t:CDS:2 [Cetraspora pellucida]|uniref:2470_t:CDS:1 n=1 Tax=Cetraspora pellucida TaxID=1433469 RepID=A0A9N9G3C7_9GLOM|nr:2470_t:CDS:2 [Cetraspora pellucida]
MRNTQSIIRYPNITYPETSIQPNLTGIQPHIIDIAHYNDNRNIEVVRISRVNYISGINRCFEQRLLLRVILANGSVIPINLDNIEEIQDINYCYVSGIENPISIYPLFDQYIIVTYTHATNTSDNTTFMDRGVVLDWSGKNISTLDFGPAYLSPGTTIWHPDQLIRNNIIPKNGFLYLSAVSGTNNLEWKQYEYKGEGRFALLHNDTFDILDNNLNTNFQFTVLSTLNGGYAIVYVNSTNNIYANSNNNHTASDQFTAGIYVTLLNYNQTKTSQKLILHEMTTPNISFSGISCSVNYDFMGHTCMILVQQLNVEPNNITTTKFFIKITFHSTGSVTQLRQYNIPIDNAFPWLKILRFGGFMYVSRKYNGQTYNFSFSLYDESDQPSNWTFPQQPIISNIYGSFDLLPNNTMLVALNELSTSWTLLSIDLPSLIPAPRFDSGYGNLQIKTTYPLRNTKDLPLNTDMIKITFFDRVSFSSSNANLTIYQTINQTDVLRQLINSKNCTGCNALDNVIMLNVLNCTFNDPGGHYYIKMDNNFVKNEYDESIAGIDANIWRFQTENKQYAHLGDIKGILRLTITGSQDFQGLDDSGRQNFFNTLIEELTLIIPVEKGRLESNGHYQLDTSKILISLLIREAKDEKLTAKDIKNDLHQLIINKAFTSISGGKATNSLDETYGFQQAPLRLGLIIPNFILSILFVVRNSNDIPMLHLPRGLVTTLVILTATDYEYLTILRDVHIFTKKLYRYEEINIFNIFKHIFGVAIIWGAFIDIFLRNIPQIIVLAVSKFIIFII